MSYNGIGLATARGSGTNGYVQRNMSSLKAKPIVRKDVVNYLQAPEHAMSRPANQEILDHERKRLVEIKCLEMEDKWTEEGVDPDEIEERISALRKKLLTNLEELAEHQKKIKEWQVHQIAEQKEKENKRFEEAFGIRRDFVSGESFDRDLQEQKKVERQQEREQKEKEYQSRKKSEKKQRERELEEERLEKEREVRLERNKERKSSPHSKSRERSQSRSRERYSRRDSEKSRRYDDNRHIPGKKASRELSRSPVRETKRDRSPSVSPPRDVKRRQRSPSPSPVREISKRSQRTLPSPVRYSRRESRSPSVSRSPERPVRSRRSPSVSRSPPKRPVRSRRSPSKSPVSRRRRPSPSDSESSGSDSDSSRN